MPTPPCPVSLELLRIHSFPCIVFTEFAGTSTQTVALTSLHDQEWPGWKESHPRAFNNIKDLVTSAECLTVIDHDNPGTNRIWLTTDASDWRTGAVLSWGPTWESARPVAFDSMQLKGAQLRYPVHEKELLAIVRAVKKFRADLLGEQFTIYTDHRTLENFNTQKSLSRRQARWLEELSQFDMEICYIKGEDNTVADALSRLPQDDLEVVPDCDDSEICNWQAWMLRGTSAAVNRASIHADSKLLTSIREGYLNDNFCMKFRSGHRILPSVWEENGLWFISSRLIIPRCGSIREDLFHLAHDVFDHAGPDKAYETLCDSFYWPNMRCDLQRYYIPGCEACARNKSSTSKPFGPAHPLPVPDDRCSSVAMDFVGPLPDENGYNCLLTMTC
ncbi:hypothetical protein MPER_02734 [Moniliophthora perniciosa FA553]|nr:hypothetical protein MPER_02734 [Moniliophthora perniciosa FA553]